MGEMFAQVTAPAPKTASLAEDRVSSPPAGVTALVTANHRRLAMVSLPATGEALPSWVERVAASHALPPGMAALLLGLQIRPSRGDVRPVLHGIGLTESSRRGLVATTGLAPDTFDAMVLTRYAGTALDLSTLKPGDERSVQGLVHREWALFHASRACPTCLADSNGVWPLWWRLGAAAVCPTHRTLLIDTCPTCRIRLRRGYAHHPCGLSRMIPAEPLRCGNLGRAGRCRQWLPDLPATTVPEALVQAQDLVLRAATGQGITLAGRAVQPSDWFAALRLLSAMARFAAPTDHLAAALADLPEGAEAFTRDRDQREAARAGMPARLSGPPITADLAGAILTLAAPVLGAVDRASATQAIAPLTEAFTRRCRDLRHNPIRGMAAPKPLADILAATTPGPPTVSSIASTAAIGGPPQASLQFRHIPHLIDPNDYTELIAPHLPHTADATGRRMAALAVARLAGAQSWPHAAECVDMHVRYARNVADRPYRRIGDPRRFWTAIASVMNRMIQRGPVDYAARRRALARLREVPARVLRPACRPLGLVVTVERCAHAAAWLWTLLTCGDVREAPAYTLVTWNATAKSLAEGRMRFARWLTSAAAEGLRAWGISLIEDGDAA